MTTALLLLVPIGAILAVFLLTRRLAAVTTARPEGRRAFLLTAVFMLVAVANSSIQFVLNGSTAHAVVIVVASIFALWFLYRAWNTPT